MRMIYMKYQAFDPKRKYYFYIANNLWQFKGYNSLPASEGFCCLLLISANSLDPDQDWQNVGPDLDPNHLTLW